MFEGWKVSDRIVSIDRHYTSHRERQGHKIRWVRCEGWQHKDRRHRSLNTFSSKLSMRAYAWRTDCIRMQQKLMNVRVRCVAADAIYANNANRKFCTIYGISTSFVRGEGRPRVILWEKFSEANSQGRGYSAWRQLWHTEAALLAIEDKGTELEDGNPVDFLRNTYGKCRTDDW